MIKKIKASISEKLIFIFLILLVIFTLSFTIIIKNKCLFVNDFDYSKKIKFKNIENIVVLNVEMLLLNFTQKYLQMQLQDLKH